PVNATDVVKAATRAIGGGSETDTKLGVETVNVNPGANQEPPRSDAPPSTGDPAATTGDPLAQTPAAAGAPPGAAGGQQQPAAGELTPNVADANELKPNVPADPNALPPPQQTNELATDGGSPKANASASSSAQKPDDLVDISSSK